MERCTRSSAYGRAGRVSFFQLTTFFVSEARVCDAPVGAYGAHTGVSGVQVTWHAELYSLPEPPVYHADGSA